MSLSTHQHWLDWVSGLGATTPVLAARIAVEPLVVDGMRLSIAAELVHWATEDALWIATIDRARDPDARRAYLRASVGASVGAHCESGVTSADAERLVEASGQAVLPPPPTPARVTVVPPWGYQPWGDEFARFVPSLAAALGATLDPLPVPVMEAVLGHGRDSRNRRTTWQWIGPSVVVTRHRLHEAYMGIDVTCSVEVRTLHARALIDSAGHVELACAAEDHERLRHAVDLVLAARPA